MKKHRNIVITLVLLIIAVPVFTNAASSFSSSLTKRSLGARVTKSGQSAEIACRTVSGPIFISPFVRAVVGPYFIKDPKAVISTRKLLLSKYSTIPNLDTCYNPETGAPIPAFEIKPYGISR